MKKTLKRTSAMLAAVMTVTSMGLTALADNYTDSEVYYNDFSSGEVSQTINRNNTINYIVNLDEYNIVNMKRGASSPNANISDGKLKIVAEDYNNAGGGTKYNGTEGLSRTFVKFNKDFDISTNVTDKLIVGYDLSINDIYFPQDKTTVSDVLACGGLFQYTGATAASMGVFNNDIGFNVNPGCIGIAIQGSAETSGATKAETAGLYFRTGSKTLPIQSTGTYKSSEFAGIFSKPLGDTFHIEYEITPATETASARVTKVTISDQTDTVDFTFTNESAMAYKLFNLTDITSISGIRFDAYRCASYDIDNITAHYGLSETPLAAAVNPENVSLKDKLNVKLNCWIDETTADGIVVKNGENVIANADIDITRSAVTYETDIAVTIPSMQYGTTYTVEIPDTLKSDLGETFSYTALNYTTMPLPNVTPQMTVSDGTKTVGSISELAGKYAKCDVSAVSEKNVSALFVVALYDSENKIVSYGAQYADFKADAAEEMTVSFPVPENTDGMSIKAFACESLDKADIKLGATAELK